MSDSRSALDLMRQWEKLNNIRRQLVTQGLLDSKAKPAEVVAALRQIIPEDLFTEADFED